MADRIDFSKMPIDERLCVAGTLEEFRAAARSGNRLILVKLMKRVGFSQADAERQPK
jgi:hypothetical protein